MKTLLTLIVSLALLAGCAAQTPQQRADKAHAIYTDMLVAADQKVQQHGLTKDQERTLRNLVPVARSALDAVDGLVPVGGSAFEAAINALYDVVAQINAAKAATTQPSGGR